ncbi:type II and III secretion system protein, partial [bacterium]|nr:type II and III secretion system protein [bacterium]
ELKNYQRILYPYGIQIKASPQAIKTIPLVEVSIVAAEIQRTEMSRLGIQWPATTSFQVLPKWNAPQASLIATLHHLEEIGKGRVLAKPTLLSQSGEEATFHSGGEFPIKTMNQFNANVVWKKYGLILKIKPRADQRGKMDLQIDCEFSSLDSREDDSGVPGLIVHRVTSHLNLEQSKTIALSGLIKEEWRKNNTGLPWLLKVPILSPLFSSQSYQNNQSELIFFVTPKVVR